MGLFDRVDKETVLLSGNYTIEEAIEKLGNTPARTGEVFRLSFNIQNKEGWSKVLPMLEVFDKDPKFEIVKKTVTTYGFNIDVKIIANPILAVLIVTAIAIIGTSLMVFMTVREIRKIYSPAPEEVVMEEEIVEEVDPMTGTVTKTTKRTVPPTLKEAPSFNWIYLAIGVMGVIILTGGIFAVKKGAV